MIPSDPPPKISSDPPDPAGAPGVGPDPLEALSERIRSAQEAAERLVREATETAQAAGASGPDDVRRPPPNGFAVPPTEAGPGRAEAQALVALLELVRSLVPSEVRVQLLELVRELLLVIRTAIDWYLERLDAGRRAPVEVEDIPIG